VFWSGSVLLAVLPKENATRRNKHADTPSVTSIQRKDINVANKNNTPKPGWWAVQHNIGNDKRLTAIPEQHVLAALGLWLACEGYSIATEEAVITEPELTRHLVVGAASSESVLEAAKYLIEAGIWTEVPGIGIDCGADHHIQAKTDRIERARRGGLAKSANSRPIDAHVPDEEPGYFEDEDER
jgi:hypothetical protein